MGKNKLNINLLIENSHPALMPSVVARVSGPNSYNSPDLLSDEHISKKKTFSPHTCFLETHTNTHTHNLLIHASSLSSSHLFARFLSLPPLFTQLSFLSFAHFSPSFPLFPLSLSLPLCHSLSPSFHSHNHTPPPSLSLSLKSSILLQNFLPPFILLRQSDRNPVRDTLSCDSYTEQTNKQTIHKQLQLQHQQQQ